MTRHEYEELELRVAQLEHRLRLVEKGLAAPPRSGGTPVGASLSRRRHAAWEATTSWS